MLDQTVGEDPRRVIWAADRDGRMIATATTKMDWNQGVALLGFIAVDPSMRGLGIARSFLIKVLGKTFADERIALNIYTSNRSAIRTYENLGFVREGVRRSLAKLGDEWWDAAHYSMLRAELSLHPDWLNQWRWPYAHFREERTNGAS